VPVSATITQDGGREVPVAWPMSASWTGDRLAVDDGTRPELERALMVSGVLRLNTVTGELTAVAPGTATVQVTVNGVTETVAVKVVREKTGR
jgi:hypothetical protein